MGLFDPKWKSKNRETALKAVEKISDQATLAKVAMETYNISVRKRAFEKISDQQILIDIIKNAKYSSVSQEAVNYVVDKSLLERLVTSDSGINNVIRERVSLLRAQEVSEITDPDVLARIVETDDRLAARTAALNKIDDQALFAKIVRDSQSYQSQLVDIALSKLSEQSLLENIARNENNYVYRLMATNRISDRALAQELYALIAQNDEGSGRYYETAVEAAEKLTEQKLLVEVARKAGSREARKIAYKKLIEQGAINEYEAEQLEIFYKLTHKANFHEKDYFATTRDLHKFTSADLIAKLALETEAIHYSEITVFQQSSSSKPSPCIERVAMKCLPNIEDVDVLKRIAAESKYDSFRWMACTLCGGHHYDDAAQNMCKCIVCGHQAHDFGEFKTNDICSRCGGRRVRETYTVTIRYKDGSSEELPYDRLAYLESTEKRN